MSMIKVTSTELDAVSTQLTATSGDISTQLSSARGHVDGLVNEGWAGAASLSFKELYEEWNRSADQLKVALDGIAAQLKAAAKAYQDTEDSLASQLRG
ncbi:WXG100 family type VII secretion target [Nakamurella antarctica]|uniref:ESAT-6-like protein n=1 Tax=Nakamurella antarctica TaxID=1902245 RepID=A0A3G8ZNL7_9ACTN|nr:WXG100 family type VII secretion target [Nakamurella antarctica]AZI58833.1 WXG100 family type VII secretion target [Nakamurella antarctica]